MGSQTLEILRQGVWASLTGGWFYDPHQNLFCNTVHLYIWLFLLCLPFSVYLYYPNATVGWAMYCTLVTLLFSGIKLLNHSLHHLYDTSECIVIPRDEAAPSERRSHGKAREDEGIELQPLGTCRLTVGGASTDNESVTSIEYLKPNTSTIDLKVDVHRKNSSESSVEDSAASVQPTYKGAHTKLDLCTPETSVPQNSDASVSRARSRPVHRRDKSAKSRRSQGQNRSKVEEEFLGGEIELRSNRATNWLNSEEPLTNESASMRISRKLVESIQRCRPQNRDFFKEWLYLDGAEASGEPYLSKFARQLSSDSHDNSELSISGGQSSPKEKAPSNHSRYMNENCTQSSIALAQSQSSNMRRNSNATMSTIQLPLLNSTAQLVSHMRRHSNATDASLNFLPTGSVELGAYMMEKTKDHSGNRKVKIKSKSSGVRRIKSAALEIGCPPPSISNLSPHPNSVETIGGQVLKNPKNSALPPPSKCLIRNPHLNLYPKSMGDAVEGYYPCLNYGSEIVYPIAEISDEMQTSQKESDLDSVSGESYSEYDYEDESSNPGVQFLGFDWGIDWEPKRSPNGNSSDSDYENNGSRSPLLDRGRTDVRVVRARSDRPDLDAKRQFSCSDRQVNKVHCPDHKISDKSKSGRLKKLVKGEVQTSKKVIDGDGDHVTTEPNQTVNTKRKRNEIEDAPNVKTLSCVPSDYFDKASASSKDFLIEKSSVESNESPLQRLLSCKPECQTKKLWDQDISNSSNSIEASQNKHTDCSDESDCKNVETKCELEDSTNDENNSLCGLKELFEEHISDTSNDMHDTQCGCTSTTVEKKVTGALGENCSNVQKNLGAIPKQLKNLARSRALSEKENKKRDSKHKCVKEGEVQNEEMILMDAVEAQAALVQGLECLFRATNANTVVMPTRDERPRSYRGERNTKTRKRPIEEVAHQSTSTLLPTSMPLLAAFLHSRVDFPHLPIYLPSEPNQPPANNEVVQTNEETQKPLMDRNHRNRVKKIKRATRKRNQPISQNSIDKDNDEKTDSIDNSSNVHFATSFNDTTDGAIHCFLDEHGNWMSYTFDKNSSGKAVPQLITPQEKDDKNAKINQVKPIQTPENVPEPSASVGSCVSLESDANTCGETSKKRVDSVDNSSSNQDSNNPLLASNNNLSSLVPININTSSTRFYMFDGGTGTHHDQPRSPVAYVTHSLLEQIEADRQSRMGLPSMHINFLMNRNNNPPENLPQNILSIIPTSRSMEDRLDLGNTANSNKFRILDEIEKEVQPKPKTYYKYRPIKCWEVKVTLDRLQLMSLFDRNLTFKETFFSVILAIMVSVLGSMILSLGFYKDIYAFWFCFIIAGSQYSLLKSVQPDSASPVHGFNKMVLFSRPVYFCLCTGILYAVHIHLDTSEPHRTKRSYDDKSVMLYGLVIKEMDFLYAIQEILTKFMLFFPLTFSLGLFPQVNTFLMYLLEQIDMHIFGGNATSSLSASIYCFTRSLTAVGIIYGFAYSGLIELRKSQHILFSIFCGLVVPIAYHLSRSPSDYTLLWNLIKKHLLPPELYIVHDQECSAELGKGNPDTLSEKSTKKNNSETNISKQNSIGSSASKINFSSETNISKTQKRSQTSSVSSLKFDPRAGDTLCSSSSLKVDAPTESIDQSKLKPDDKSEENMEDPLPKKLQETVNSRLKNDVIVCTFLALVVFGIHCTTVFTTLKPELLRVLWCVAGSLGWVLHYLAPQLRKQQPWLCLSSPVLLPAEHTRTEVGEPAKLMWFEKVYVYLCFMERNVLYPTLFVAAATQDAPSIVEKFGPGLGALFVSVCTLKCLRNAYSDPDNQYLILVFAVLLFQLDYNWASETFLLDYALMAIIFNKTYEFLLKIQFVVTYIAPWQITWGSAFHAFAQPFSVPHSAMLFLQAALSALISAPLNPILGSAIFVTSYVRPVKFWERDYNTKRVDQSNTRLSSQLERNLGADDNNLNSIFYEHLTRSLQNYLYGDLSLGRWGQVQQGDCFVLASDYLNCLVHIVEMGNGLVSFQLRGLEFRGTYCQQREVEAISEGPNSFNERCCIQGMLSLSTAWSLRWLAWQLNTTRYVLEGYSVSDNSVVTVLQVFEFRKLLITYYVKSIIYYTVQSGKLEEWLSSPTLVEALKPAAERTFVDLDPIFNVNLDEDYDCRNSGITRASFCSVYLDWITYCDFKREDKTWRRGENLSARDSPLVTLCFALSLVGRRALGAASHNSISSVEFFLYGLHSLFKGDFRIMCSRDEWVFTDMSLLHSVLAPAVRMALKLHQDHFMYPEEYCNCSALYSAISCHARRLVICHEAAPAWRYNVLRGAPHLLALRHIMDEGTDDYKIIMLNKRQLMFRVIKLNRECVRGLWAGQQQELVYLRNRNPERGSIQNAKQALRNIINSSCDQPIGYPIYVSPLTTSYADSSPQLTSLVGGAVTVKAIKEKVTALWRRIRRRCGEGCSSGGAAEVAAGAGVARRNNTPRLEQTSLAGTRGSLASAGKPTSTLASLATLLREHSHEQTPDHTVYTTIRETSTERKRKTEEGHGGGMATRAEEGFSGARSGEGWSAREQDGRHCTRHSSKEARQIAVRERLKLDAGRRRREREPRPQSFRQLSTRERDSRHAESEMPSVTHHPQMVPARPPTPDSSLEDLTLNPNGLDLSLSKTDYVADCKIIVNRSAARFPQKEDEAVDQGSFKRFLPGETSKEFCRVSRDIKHERESFRDLTGKYSELPKDSALALKDPPKYSDMSAKESGLRISGKDFGSKDQIKKDKVREKSLEGQKEMKTKIKRSDSSKTELKMNVSVGCKVIITDPDGVYNCVNLGRRIDVQWPSEHQRERGGKNYWGNWVPLEGMDGQVVHKWTPNHRDPKLRSHVDKTLLLVQIDDKFVPIAENCVQDLGDEV